MDKAFEEMPIENNQVAPDDICFYLIGNYYDAGAKEKGDKLGKKLALLELEKIDHYQNLNEYFFDKVWSEWGKALNNLEFLRLASIGGFEKTQDEVLSERNQYLTYMEIYQYLNRPFLQEAMVASDPTNTFFRNQGALEGTGYSATLIKSKQIFLKKGNTKQKFFQNQQKFPIELVLYCWMKQ